MNLNNGDDFCISTRNDVVPCDENWQDLLGFYSGVLQDEIVPLATTTYDVPANFETNNVQNVKYNNVPQKINSLAELIGNDSQKNQDLDGYNLHQMIPHSRLPVSYRPSYNLNLPASPEVAESSTAARPSQLAPTTPDQQKQTKNYQIIQTPHLSIEDISPQENDVVLHQRLEFVDTEHNALGTSSATPKDKQTFDGEIDLNKTPTQKTPKRRKHRPKVVIEGKPKRTPKPKATPPDGNTTTKRKYVRRKGIQTTTNQASDAATEVEVSNHDSIAKSCKRALNFDLETGVEKKSQRKDNEVNKVSFNLNEASDNAEWCAELNEQSNSAAKQVHQENLNEFVHSVDKTSPQETFVLAATEPQAASRDRTLNIIARSLNVGNAYINQSGDQGKHGEVHNRIGGSLAQLVIQANTSERNLQTSSQRLEDMVNVDEKQRSQREYSYIDLTQPLMGSQIWSYGVVETSHYNVESCKLWQNGSESNKTKKVEDKITGTSSSMPFGNIQSYESSPSGGLPYSGGNSTSCLNVIDEINKVTRYWNTNTEDSRDGIQKQVKLYEMVDSPARMPVKKQTEARQTSSKKTSTKDKVLQQKTKNIQGHGHYSKKVTGLQEDKMTTVFVDFITDRMKDLRIDNNGNETAGALVPYRADGAVVPYEVFDPIKKRRTRPKVDLDPETNRLWSLLMGKEGSDGAETMDNDKHVRWEEERKVFRGRVDSFISQMHLVQGDRRFSKWKGSVVDSVIGVFLTQNVSDHLSSSAFMSLAAKFPIKSTTIRETCCLNMGNPSIEREVLVTFPDGTSYDHRTINETTYDSNVNPERTFLMNNHTRRMDQGMISSQGSSESIVYKASEDIKSSSGSNSEPEDRITRSNNHGSLNLFERIAAIQQYLFPETESPLITYQQPENPYSYPSTCSWQKMTTSLEKWEADNAMLGKQSTSSFTSTDFGITNGTRIERAHDKAGLISESSLTAQPTRQSKSQPDTGQRFIDYRGGGMQETFQQDNAFQTEPTRSAEAFSKQLSDDPKQTENMKKVHSPNVSPSKIGTSPNARKRKAEKEKAEPFDWDTLRKEVQSNGGTGGRSMDTMDSLDYETLRNADVRQISEAIKERGMNNMLAERIKDFLNRLVRDHGQVDLEWLRNVQPDKVKDYLLSIRGLGLKSVECVRLLTLHHLAFPVDTNVGRIAVRLGWVPLQPLPESLQLHLLELYPVLESIQKYLWPRLCMLDQETLYELHYQMITFGKVFCTKREPNCNACPLRAQCRHFASAFASARLALPSPEEGRIVTSSSLRNFNSSSSVGINSLLLPPSENQTMGSTRNCEPIIEEPTTPELPAEMLEQDIEDVFYEDPNEIPVININIQEFTTNLQNIIQENMDMQEGDMSKALVALSPQLASIPMPKLKHISRLRTEHQVYELPDSHPLLKGLDRREPDDPSPYLLAIWTPGETADSVQPPESKCSSLEGGLCNNETCFSCNSTREAQAQTVRGTILIPCRTAMRGSFPLNGTYFQVNEVFADHESSMKPIDVPRSLIWNLSRRKVFFGTSVSTIFKGMSTDDIQQCFWRGFVCVRGFEQKSRAPRPLMARFHLPASKMAKKSA